MRARRPSKITNTGESAASGVKPHLSYLLSGLSRCMDERGVRYDVSGESRAHRLGPVLMEPALLLFLMLRRLVGEVTGPVSRQGFPPRQDQTLQGHFLLRLVVCLWLLAAVQLLVLGLRWVVRQYSRKQTKTCRPFQKGRPRNTKKYINLPSLLSL